MASGGKAAKGRTPSKDRYLLPAGKKHAKREDEKAKPEADDQFMPGAAAARVGELLLTSFDPFADAERGDGEDGGAPVAPRGDVVHLHIQQRNGRKNLTTVQGLSAAYNYAKIFRDLKRELCCSGIMVEDEDLGNVVQPQGDHRKAVAAFLVKAGIVTKTNVKIHGSNKITELVKRTKLKKRASVRRAVSQGPRPVTRHRHRRN
ncbi:Protein translation factor SUI1-like protein [Dichanthelium oligosanthes]|uniref:Protein translation factor SUI1-like protein n=1 Tax=Dichanthelium oligosanthes TaxID=888268 RepID=A0A1E5VM18_9POAL|nr:Protein translation factor SUI1-like protein [Dichanthelium oligosanthes]